MRWIIRNLQVVLACKFQFWPIKLYMIPDKVHASLLIKDGLDKYGQSSLLLLVKCKPPMDLT